MRFIIFSILLLVFATSVFAQTSQTNQTEFNNLESNNFTMPSSPAFDLLGVSPSEIHKPGLPRDFQISWLLRGGGLDPNLAIEVEPGWLFLNRKKSFSEYRKSGWLFQTASTLNFSIGTAKIDNQQSLAYGLKLNLYNANNPLLDKELIDTIARIYKFTPAEEEQNVIKVSINLYDDPVIIDSLYKIIDSLAVVIESDSIKNVEKAQDALTQWERENWNATMIDLGFGQIFDYELPTIFEVIDTLETPELVFKNKAYALWLSGIFGIGNNGMINAMAKYINDGENSGIKAGLSTRYGNEKINIYAEYAYNSMQLTKNTIAYGLDYKLDNGFIMQASLRTMFDNVFELKQLIPTINLAFQPQMKRNGS